MLFSVPLFTVTNFLDEPNSYDFGLSLIFELGTDTTAGRQALNDTIVLQTKLSTPLI